jgi:2-dehydro-3-deoxyphosphogluconate aldolase/(4S)-4-hydroxy-2-oxoglutarate aldolase
MDDVLTRIGQLKIVPIVTMEDAGVASALGDALVAGGLPIVEVTFRTEAAEQSIRTLSRRGDLLVGAGTVLTIDVAKRAVDAGAKFIITPGFNSKVVDWCVKNQIVITPGTATPTDVDMALDHGVKVVKFFPAEPMGGINTLKAIAAPFGMMQFIPTGGIDASNVAEYLKFPKVLACGGSWMASKEMLAAKQWDRVAELAQNAVKLAQKK